MSPHRCSHRILLTILLPIVALIASSSPLLLTAVNAQISPYLQIETSDLYNNVVVNGVVVPAWSIDHAHNGTGPYSASPYEYPSYTVTPTWTDPNATQTMTFIYSSSDATILTTTLPTESTTLTGLNQGFFGASMTQCVKEGTATITVELQLTAPNCTPLQWAYTITCTPPLIQIGSTPYDSDIVQLGVAQQSFSNWIQQNTGGVTLYMYSANDNTTATPFILANVFSEDSRVQPQPQSATYNNTVNGNNVLLNSSSNLGIMFIPIICSQTVPAFLASVEVLIQYNWATPLSFTFLQQCGTFDSLPTMSLGTSAYAQDIAQNGQVTPTWGGTQVVRPNGFFRNQFMLHLCLGCNVTGSEEERTLADQLVAGTVNTSYHYSIIVDQTNTQIYTPVPFGDPAGVLILGSDMSLSYDIICSNEGVVNTTYQVAITALFSNGKNATYQPMVFAFQYTCIQPSFDVYYNTSDVMSVEKEEAVGHTHLQALLYKNQLQQAPPVIPTSETTSLFQLGLDSTTVFPDGYNQQWYTISFETDVTVMDPPTVNDPNNGLATIIPLDGSPNNQISVTWNCLPSNHTIQSPVTLRLAYGWNQQPIQMKFVKQCYDITEPPTPDNGGGGGGMSPAGIFFLVLFLILLVAFIGGCAFNYFYAGARGLHIIPGYAFCSSKCGGGSSSGTSYSSYSDSTNPRQTRSTNYGGFRDEENY